MKKLRVKDIFELAGGSVHIAARFNIHQTTVLAWERAGIPPKYWKELMSEFGLSEKDLFNASEIARNEFSRK